ncbi:MAG TPA: saccharopine dehydrogenase NADP-binding domain-containing protein [Myxococcales bacterium]|nr:saccharopine dehydrogenase NADP-binding domain-containing protein [Myxococcales bacterium]
MAWMIYGANGYTGQLIAELCKERGEAPVLAARAADKVRPLAERLGMPWRAFALDRPDLKDIALVLHCAGPFSATSRPMVDACLAAGAHYLDITGEIEVFESVLARDGEAKERGVVLLPGTGFDVVPSDCLAALLKRRLPSATSLELAFAPGGRGSPGTLKTSIETLPRGGLVRRGGRLVKVPPAHEVREIPFADKTRRAMAVPWGDVATAWRSTQIPDITVFMAAKPSVIRAARLTRFTAPLLALPPVQGFLKGRIERAVRGPGPAERARSTAQFWGRASDGSRSVEMTMTVPEGYTLTAEASLACARKVLSGAVKAGAWTPSLAFGPDFAASLPGVRVAER